MIVKCFQISNELQLTSCDYGRAVEAARDPAANIWIDVQGFEDGELEDLLEKLEVRDLAGRLCLEARDRPGFYPLNTMIFLVIPIQAVGDNFHEAEYAAFLCRENLLLTLRSTRVASVQSITTLDESADWLPNSSIAGLVSATMIVLSLESLQRSAELRKTIMTLEERMDREPNSVDVSEISDRRSELLTLEAVVNGQLPALQALMATDRQSFNLETTRESLICAMANLQATDKSLQWLEGRIDVIRSLFDMHSQKQMNRRLGRLTILSVIFMPMTLLAGIWGMNFDFMPELTSPFGYPFALGSMVFIGTAMYFCFRRKGWFD